MELQEEIIKAVQDNQPEFISYISRTDLIKIAAFGALLVLEEPFEPVSADNGIIGDVQECTIYLILESVNPNEMTEDAITAEDAAMKANLRALIEIIETGTKNLRYGRGDTYRATIDSKPVLIAQLVIKGQYNYKLS